ncbi:LARP7 [Branchiostoma lanceolatum]|uniref:LARP7 protein n=1 Tax=Branchiostoma lanceolatum TaxID=7740 RepID=A0A8J9ZKS7_BRALA|nr:LARP7 [Branchiostoma lanceolatum]
MSEAGAAVGAEEGGQAWEGVPSGTESAAHEEGHNAEVLIVPDNKAQIAVQILQEYDGNEADTGSIDSRDVSPFVSPRASRDPSPESHPDGGEWTPPDDELKDKIIQQVEFYFSDANILKDAFLLKHVRRNKEGLVNIKLITSFRKVKSLTKDWRAVAYSLKQAESLKLNEEGTKVGRKEPLPDYDETTPSRTIVAMNLGVESPTIEKISAMFSHCGDIALIRIIRPGGMIPQDVRKHMSRHPEVGNNVCAVVEFEKHESAQMAVDTMSAKDDWRKGMHVALLAPCGKKKDKKERQDAERRAKDDTLSEGEGDKAKKDKQKKKKRRSRVEELAHGDEPAVCSSGSSDVEVDGLSPSPPHRSQHKLSPTYAHALDPNRLSPGSSPRSSPANSPRNSPRMQRKGRGSGVSPLASSPKNSPRPSPMTSPEMRRKRVDAAAAADWDPGASHSPWVQRRLLAAKEASRMSDNSPGTSPLLPRKRTDSNTSLGLRPRTDSNASTGSAGGGPHMVLIRQPRAPDGSGGFHPGIGRRKPTEEDTT